MTPMPDDLIPLVEIERLGERLADTGLSFFTVPTSQLRKLLAAARLAHALREERDAALGRESDAERALAARDYAKWREAYDSDLGQRIVALSAERNALREEQAALRAVVEAARLWDHWGKMKALHILTCKECERLEGAEDRWCNEVTKIAREQLRHAKALMAALAALDAAPGVGKDKT